MDLGRKNFEEKGRWYCNVKVKRRKKKPKEIILELLLRESRTGTPGKKGCEIFTTVVPKHMTVLG